MRFTGANAGLVLDWMDEVGSDRPVERVSVTRGEFITIATLEGDMTASAGDWIIRGVKGKFYPCKPDIFDATYVPVDPDEVAS